MYFDTQTRMRMHGGEGEVSLRSQVLGLDTRTPKDKKSATGLILMLGRLKAKTTLKNSSSSEFRGFL
jgi:hypothetical protein